MSKIEEQRRQLELDENINLVNFRLPDSNDLKPKPLLETLENSSVIFKNSYIHDDVLGVLSRLEVEGFASLKTDRDTGRIKGNPVQKILQTQGLMAYSRSTRDKHIDHRARFNEVANTLSTGDGCRNMSTQNFVIDRRGIRPLTVLESERLQGWPDDHTKWGRIDDKTVYQIPTKERFKLVGNGVTSKVSKTLLEAFLPSGRVRVGSTFSGAGGTELELLERFEVLFHSDNDKYSSDVLRYRFPDIPNYGDIRDTNTAKLPEIDLLLGGFSCQPFSIAGKRAGFDDARGTLFFELVRILKEKKVPNFMFENVKGLLSHDKGKTFKKILEVLSELGYSVDYKVVNSRNFGVLQSRERVFIFGRLNE